MHHIRIGRAHRGEPVVLLIDDLDIRVIRVIHRTTGEVLRHLTLDPTRNYQTPKMTGPEPTSVGSGLADVSRHHIGVGGRI
jgi:hypothetical protein